MASLNLDRLKREPLSVTLDGVDHVLAPPALALLGKLADLSRIAKDDGAAQRTATLDLLGRIAPSLKAHGALDTLEDEQAAALIEFWTSPAKAESAEAQAVLTDPTSPG